MRAIVLPSLAIAAVLLSIVSVSDGTDAHSFDDVTGVMVVESDVPDYGVSDTRPWESYASDIRAIVVSEGVTSIGDRAFSGCDKVTSVSLPSSLTGLGAYAFSGCLSLTSLEVGSVNLVGDTAPFHDAGLLGPGIGVTFTDSVSVINGLFDGSERISSIDLGHAKEIADRAFFGVDGTEFVIPLSLEDIGDLAFYGCDGIEEVSFGKDLTHLGIDAFYGCSNLREVHFDAELCSDLGTDGAFRDTGAGMTFALGTNCTYVPSNLFHGADVSVLTVADSVTSIGKHAFRGFDSSEVVLHPGLKTIAEEAFLDCGGLRSIVLSQTTESIGKGAFDGCSGLTTVEFRADIDDLSIDDVFFRYTGATDVDVTVGSSHIPDHLFIGLSGMTSLTLDGVTSIGNYSFAFCTSLKTVDLAHVSSIGIGSFLGCDSLDTVTFGDDVKSIGNEAFNGCGVTDVVLPDVTMGKGVFANNPLTNVTFEGKVSCVDGSLSGMDGLTVEFFGSDIVLDPQGTFRDCDALELRFLGDSIPDSVLESFTGSFDLEVTSSMIGSSAFEGCIGLNSLTIGDSVSEIRDRAFAGCGSVKSLVIPVSVSEIGDSAFSGMGSLETLDFRASDVSVHGGKEPFSGSGISSGMSVTVHGNVPARTFTGDPVPKVSGVTFLGTVIIGDSAFRHTSLTAIDLPDPVGIVGEYAFADTDIVSIDIPDGAMVHPWAFSDCTSMISVDVSKFASISDHLFDGCSSLKDVVFGHGLDRIGNGAFKGTAVVSVQLPYSLSSIGYEAFSECTGLEHLTILAHHVSIGDRAFDGCPLEVLEMQKGTTLGEDVFTLPGSCLVLWAGCPFGTMLSGCNVYPGQGLGGNVVIYDLNALGHSGFMVFGDTVVDTTLIPSNGREFVGWVFDDGTEYTVGTDPGEVTLYGTWVGAGHDVPTEPLIDPQILDIIACISMLVAVACMVLANIPRRSP